MALSVPPFGAWPVAFLGAGLLYWRLLGLPLRARLLAGWLAGVGCFAIGLFWAESFNWYGAVVLVALEALFPAVAAGLSVPGPARGLAFVGAETLLEAARMTWPFGGLPVGGVFLGQAGGPLLGAARLGGPLLLTAALWAGGVAVGELVALVSRRTVRPVPWAGAVALVLVVGAGAAGALAPDGGPAVGHLEVAAVQGGGVRGYSAIETGRPGDFAAELAASGRLASVAPRPGLVVWPEDVVALERPLAGSPDAARVGALASTLGATVLAGVTEPEPHDAFRNEIVAWGPSGAEIGVFEKVHRVPFGEYVPWRGFFSHLASLAAVPRDAIAGHGSGLMRTPAAPVGILVSFEVFFAARGRSAVRAGARLLVVPTNTSSYSGDQMPSQEVAADRVQAVEEGRDLVQAAPTGYSAFVTNSGAVLERSGLSVQAVLRREVTLRSGATLYERLGDLPVLVLAAGALGAALLLARRAGRAGPEAQVSP